MDVLQETLRHPSGIHGPHAPDGCIQNYDCPYHIILTNVKTNPQAFSKGNKPGHSLDYWPELSMCGGRRTSGEAAPWDGGLTSHISWAPFSGAQVLCARKLAHAEVARGLR